jgi:hypothetical protein
MAGASLARRAKRALIAPTYTITYASPAFADRRELSVKRLIPFLVIAFLACLRPDDAAAQSPLVLACSSSWGASDSCGGCSGLTWQTPSGSLLVKTPAPDFWTKLSSLPSTAPVAITTNSSINAGQNAGTAAQACAAVNGTATAASLLGTTPPPPTTSCPTPTPPVVNPPAGTGQLYFSWSAPKVDTSGKTLTDLTGYLVSWGTASKTYTASVSVTSGTSLNLANLPKGYTYYIAVQAVSSSEGLSAQANEVKASL